VRIGAFVISLLLTLSAPGCEQRKTSFHFIRGPQAQGSPSSALPAISPAWVSSGEGAAFGRFGEALAGGDVNGDGFPDLIVGASRFNGGEPNSGKIYLYLGSPEGLAHKFSWSAVGSGRDGERFGIALAGGDVNGDGFWDIAVGAIGYTENGVRTGKVYLYPGGSQGPSSKAVWMSTGEQKAGANFGASLAFGDVNGDGFSDLLIGANGYPSGNRPGAGKAYLYLGSKAGLSKRPIWSSGGDDAPHASFGYPVALFDLSGDRTADLLISAIGFSGKLFLYPGSARPPHRAHWSSVGEKQGGALFGSSLAAGDMDGDGYIDLAVGAQAMDNGGRTDGGKIYLFGGSPNGFSSPTRTAIGDGREDAFLGASAAIGDANGDGFADLLVGAPSQTGSVVNAGKVFLYPGSPQGLSPAPDWTSVGDNIDHAFFGTAVAMGDFNRDGLADLVVSAPLQGKNDEDRIGAVYVFPGRR
jgi:hypothetical protein